MRTSVGAGVRLAELRGLPTGCSFCSSDKIIRPVSGKITIKQKLLCGLPIIATAIEILAVRYEFFRNSSKETNGRRQPPAGRTFGGHCLFLRRPANFAAHVPTTPSARQFRLAQSTSNAPPPIRVTKRNFCPGIAKKWHPKPLFCKDKFADLQLL
ncbi:MAG: hypothetical protein WDM91_19000 [Rhizomicrobium sp.]